MQMLRKKYGDDRQGMRQAMNELRASTDKAISAVLTEAQQKKYDAMIAERSRGRGDWGQGNAKDKPAPQNDKAQ
jgi:hypothetical protein